MPYPPNPNDPDDDDDDDTTTGNGTLHQLLNYTLKGTPVKTWHIMAALSVLAFVAGLAL